jgi:hypothetical protein
MLETLERQNPRRIVLVGSGFEEPLEYLRSIWDGSFRSLITLVVQENQIEQGAELLPPDLAGSIVHGVLSSLVEDLVRRATQVQPVGTTRVLGKRQNGSLEHFDITGAEITEHPILDDFEVVKIEDISLLQPEDLDKDDLKAFFEKSIGSWRPYAAGLPWNRAPSANKAILRALAKVEHDHDRAVEILTVVSESGAGGTTLALQLAFSTAEKGYPTLVARQELVEPNATAIAGFLYRAHQIIHNDADGSRVGSELPWLIVFDREHWDGREFGLGHFASELQRSGRRAVILKVIGPDLVEGFAQFRTAEIAYLTHEVELADVEELGRHLNKYLRKFGSDKSIEQWKSFWERHRPDFDTQLSAFWVILEFWLQGVIELTDSLQGWLVRQFKEAKFPTDIAQIVLQIAALGIERRSVPEFLLNLPTSDKRPLSIILEDLRKKVPGLGLLKSVTPLGRYWSTAHDLLGRYLVTGVFYDRPLLAVLGYSDCQSVVDMRLRLMGEILKRPELGDKRLASYAVQFAVKTLKLDEPEGNSELFADWPKVLALLGTVPATVSRTSRTFIHHVAISKRRVAKLERFDASVDQKRALLKSAIDELRFALEMLPESSADESNAHLLNTLALAYQDLGAIEFAEGADPAVVSKLREFATEATFRALRENPTSSYVLETAAKDLLQRGRLDLQERVSSAAQALSYVFQASTLDGSDLRQRQLDRLASEAIGLLDQADVGEEIERMKNSGNPLGFLAEAWLILRPESESGSRINHDCAKTALGKLVEAPRHWMILRLQYDLTCRVTPLDFKKQLELLDELDSTPGFRLSTQLRLERSILLHLVGRHVDANDEFRFLRRAIRAESVIVQVPSRLRWLVDLKTQKRLMCTAVVTDSVGGRPLAKVRELRTDVPFVPYEFGRKDLPSGMRFRCHINFGAMGPFIKPIIADQDSQ